YSLEHRASQLEFGINFMNRHGPLNIECPIVFRQHELAVWFLTHFYEADSISTSFEICDLCGRVVGRAIQHGDRYHCREIVGNSTCKEKIEASVLVVATIAYVVYRMPRIYG